MNMPLLFADVAQASTVLEGWWVGFLATAFGLAMLALAWVFVQLQKKIGADTNATKAQLVVARWSHFAEVVVRDLGATLRPKLVAALADKKLSTDEIRQLRDEALRRMKELAGETGVEELKATLRIVAPSVDTYLFGLVETAVAKTRMPTAAIAVPAEVVVAPARP